ncbi:MAG TPA: GPW/gp25 family protein [Pseudomonadota bacterium]|nr:GPW/gp25 family protein [Pseudomonadota bacterium]
MDIRFPLQVDSLGRIASTDPGRHAIDLMEQVLFTRPGERVGRPEFGCDLPSLVFQPGTALPALARKNIATALDRFLGERLEILDVLVEPDAAGTTVEITVQYRLRGSAQVQSASFVREV